MVTEVSQKAENHAKVSNNTKHARKSPFDLRARHQLSRLRIRVLTLAWPKQKAKACPKLAELLLQITIASSAVLFGARYDLN